MQRKRKPSLRQFIFGACIAIDVAVGLLFGLIASEFAIQALRGGPGRPAVGWLILFLIVCLNCVLLIRASRDHTPR